MKRTAFSIEMDLGKICIMTRSCQLKPEEIYSVLVACSVIVLTEEVDLQY